MFAIELLIVRRPFASLAYVDSDYVCSEQRRQVMCNETVAAAHIKHARIGGEHACDLKRHVVSTAYPAPSQSALPAALNSIQ